jgi:hypothetical protein
VGDEEAQKRAAGRRRHNEARAAAVVARRRRLVWLVAARGVGAEAIEEYAVELGVGVRTIQRDVRALAFAGNVIVADAYAREELRKVREKRRKARAKRRRPATASGGERPAAPALPQPEPPPGKARTPAQDREQLRWIKSLWPNRRRKGKTS